MGLKHRYLSTDKPTVNLWFSFYFHLLFPLLLQPPIQRESSTLCFCIQVNISCTKYFREALKAPDCQQCLFSWGSWSACFSHTSGGQQILPCKFGFMGWLSRSSHSNKASARLSSSALNTSCFSWKSLKKAVWQSKSGHPTSLLSSAEYTAWSALLHTPLGNPNAEGNVFWHLSEGWWKCRGDKDTTINTQFSALRGAESQGTFAGDRQHCPVCCEPWWAVGTGGLCWCTAPQEWEQLPDWGARCCLHWQGDVFKKGNDSFYVWMGGKLWSRKVLVWWCPWQLVLSLPASETAVTPEQTPQELSPESECCLVWVCFEHSCEMAGQRFIPWWLLSMIPPKCKRKDLAFKDLENEALCTAMSHLQTKNGNV